MDWRTTCSLLLLKEFEDYLARIAQCETHIFDPTPGIRKKLKNITLPDHYHFHFEAFGGQINKELVLEPFGLQSKHLAGPQKFQTKTLDEFVAELHTPYIDILKIDVEGSELNDIYNDDKDSIWRTHRIGQVLIEVHLDFDNDETFQRLFKLFDFLVSNGFVLFHSVRIPYFLDHEMCNCQRLFSLFIMGSLILTVLRSGMECSCPIRLWICFHRPRL